MIEVLRNLYMQHIHPYLIALPLRLLDDFVAGIIDLVSWPIWVVLFLHTHRFIRNLVLFATCVSLSLGLLVGWAFVIAGWQQIASLAMMIAFMIGQFAFLFMFLSATKSIEIRPGDKTSVVFGKDYFGNEETVALVLDWVSLLTVDRAKLTEMGAVGISGMLLEGPPGTGKTTMAKGLASAAKAFFYGVVGTDFLAMFFGVGPMKVMRMYGKARSEAKRDGAAIVFIDEIDAIAMARPGVSGQEQGPVQGGMAGGMFGGMGSMGVLSRLMIEMDGAAKGELGQRDTIQNWFLPMFGLPKIVAGVVLTVGATNRISTMDPAILRAGRFDKVIRVDMPDRHDRRLLIEGYLAKLKHNPELIDIDGLVADTAGLSQADITLALRSDAPRYAIKDGRTAIEQADIQAGLQEQLVGLANPVRNMPPLQKRALAIHEAGHAIVDWVLLPEKRISRVSIIRRSKGVMGYMFSQEQEEIYIKRLAQYAAQIQVSLAGGQAVELVLGEKYMGLTGDVDNVRTVMYWLVGQGFFQDKIPFKVEDPFADKDVKKAANRYLERVREANFGLLRTHIGKLGELVDALVVEEEISSERVYEILGAGGGDETSN